MTWPMGLAASLHDALALAEAFGPGAEISLGDPAGADILAPAGAWLTPSEVIAAARLGRARYFLAFGNARPADAAAIAPLIETIRDSAGTGFLAACLAAPWAGRTVYQGCLFERGRLQADLVREFGQALDGGVGLVARATIAAGDAAIKAACARLKEQGRGLALLDAIEEEDCAAITAALAGLPLAGGGAWAAAGPQQAALPPPTGPLAILSGACDRDTIFHLAAARAANRVFDIDFAAPDPAGQAAAWAAAWAAGRLGEPFIIATSMPPDRLTEGAAAAGTLGQVARYLAAAGVRRFMIAGDETAAACLAALGVTRLTTGAGFGKLLWLQAEKFAFCLKPPGIAGQDLFLSGMEPQIRLNEPAK